MNIKHTLNLDMKLPSRGQPMHVKQGDSLTRTVELNLYSGGSIFDVSSAEILQIVFSKPDKTGGVYDTMPDGSPACIAEGNVVIAQLHPQMFTAAGLVRSELRLLTSTGIRLSTFSWDIFVEASEESNIESKSYYQFASIEAMITAINALPQYRGAADPEEFDGLLKNVVRDGFYEIANPELWEDAPLETAFCLRVMQCSEHLMLQTAFPVLSGDIPFCRVVMPRTKDVVRDWWAESIVPVPTVGNAGQVLTVAPDGKPVWSAAMNAEEVGF